MTRKKLWETVDYSLWSSKNKVTTRVGFFLLKWKCQLETTPLFVKRLRIVISKVILQLFLINFVNISETFHQCRSFGNRSTTTNRILKNSPTTLFSITLNAIFAAVSVFPNDRKNFKFLSPASDGIFRVVSNCCDFFRIDLLRRVMQRQCCLLQTCHIKFASLRYQLILKKTWQNYLKQRCVKTFVENGD